MRLFLKKEQGEGAVHPCEEKVVVESQGYKVEVLRLSEKLIILDARPQALCPKNHLYTLLKKHA